VKGEEVSPDEDGSCRFPKIFEHIYRVTRRHMPDGRFFVKILIAVILVMPKRGLVLPVLREKLCLKLSGS
jgi:hypothetical protein